ncbi:MAG: GNAT family N-acetyltransferase, partial [Acetobacteraceae bacterium]
MSVPVIRPARAEDAAPLRTLVARAWEEYPGLVFRLEDAPELAEPAAYYVARSGRLWVAEEAGAVVGSVAALPHAPGNRPTPRPAVWEIAKIWAIAKIWEIAKLYVAPAWRGRGLAERLLATAEARASGQGAQWLVLWSDTRFAPAHRFYEKHHYLRRAPLRALGDSCHSLEFPFLRPLAGEG